MLGLISFDQKPEKSIVFFSFSFSPFFLFFFLGLILGSVVVEGTDRVLVTRICGIDVFLIYVI